MTLIRMMLARLRPYRLQVSIVLALIVVQTVLGLYLPNLNADIINNGITRGNVGLHLAHRRRDARAHAAARAWPPSSPSTSPPAPRWGSAATPRRSCSGACMRSRAREMNSFGTASLITRNTNDVQQIQIFLQMALTLMVAAPIMMVGGVIMALHEDVTLSVLLVVAVPLMALIVVAMLVRSPCRSSESMQVKIDRINQVLREQITGVRVIRAFVRSDDEERRFAAANASLTATGLRVNRLFVLAMSPADGDHEPLERRGPLVRRPPRQQRRRCRSAT